MGDSWVCHLVIVLSCLGTLDFSTERLNCCLADEVLFSDEKKIASFWELMVLVCGDLRWVYFRALLSADNLYGNAYFFPHQELAPTHGPKSTMKWFADHVITVLNWPANSPHILPTETVWSTVKRNFYIKKKISPNGKTQTTCIWVSLSSAASACSLHAILHWYNWCNSW